MLYEKFNSEAEFRSAFIRPLLTKMGFLTICELDGSQEFGKDFVFSELTPFGFFRHYGVVVKHEKNIRQSASQVCQTVLAQVRQAFSVSFRVPEAPAESKVAAVLFMNSGGITPNVITWFRAELDRERYGENVHFFDGERLAQLDRQVAFRNQELLVPRITGLQNSLKMNLIVWASVLESLPQFREARGSFTRALEDYLASPFLIESIDIQAIVTLLQECRIIDAVNQRYLHGVRVKDDLRKQEIETVRSLIAKASQRAVAIDAQLQKCLTGFSPLTI